jgi:predicted nucleic acid-binding protein
MDVVVDASVLIAVVANEPEKAELIRLTEGVDLIAPQSIHWEIGNAFSAMLKRKRVTLDQVRLAIQEYEKIPIRFVDIQLDDALEIASELNIYAYDAYLIQCALEQ